LRGVLDSRGTGSQGGIELEDDDEYRDYACGYTVEEDGDNLSPCPNTKVVALT
jgi:hypothetical protein